MPLVDEMDPATNSAPPQYRSRKYVVLAVAVVAVIAAALIVAKFRGDDEARANTAAASSDQVYAAVAPVQRETIANSLSIAGQFMPYQNVELHAKVAGYIKNIYVDIGDHVHQG